MLKLHNDQKYLTGSGIIEGWGLEVILLPLDKNQNWFEALNPDLYHICWVKECWCWLLYRLLVWFSLDLLGSVPRQSAKYFCSLYCPFSFTTLTIPFSTWIEFHLSPFLFLACFFIYICNSRLSDENPAKVSMITFTLLPLSLSFLLGFWASMVPEFHALVLEVCSYIYIYIYCVICTVNNVWLAGWFKRG